MRSSESNWPGWLWFVSSLILLPSVSSTGGRARRVSCLEKEGQSWVPCSFCLLTVSPNTYHWKIFYFTMAHVVFIYSRRCNLSFIHAFLVIYRFKLYSRIYRIWALLLSILRCLFFFFQRGKLPLQHTQINPSHVWGLHFHISCSWYVSAERCAWSSRIFFSLILSMTISTVSL